MFFFWIFLSKTDHFWCHYLLYDVILFGDWFCFKFNAVKEVPKIDLAVYDLTIYVERRYFNEKTRSIPKGKRKFDEPRQRAYLPVVDLSPTNEYVKLLRENFDSIALFFYNAYNPFVIGVLFRPNFRTPRDPNVKLFRLNLIRSF